MFLHKCIFLLFLSSAVCQDGKRLSLLHLGEENDDVPNNFIRKAMESLPQEEAMVGYEIKLTPIYLKDNIGIEQICSTIAEMNNGSLTQDLIIDTTKKPPLRKIAAEIASNYRIPVLFVNSLNDPKPTEKDTSRDKYFLRFTPPNHDIHLLVKELVLAKKMSDFVVIYEKDDGKRLYLLHLGEESDDVPNNFIRKAMESLPQEEPMVGYEIKLTPIYLKDNIGIEQICSTIAEMNNGSLTQDLIIDTTKKPPLRKIAAEIASNYRIPVLFVNSLNDPKRTEEDTRNNYFLRFTPPNHDMHLLVKELVLAKRMSDFVVIYQKDVEYQMQAVRKELKPLGIPCIFTTPFHYHPSNIIIFGGWPRNKTFLDKGQVVYLIHGNEPVPDQTSTNILEVDVTPAFHGRYPPDLFAGETRGLEAAFYYELTRTAIYSLRMMKMSSSADAEEHNDCSSRGNTEFPSYRTYFDQNAVPLDNNDNNDRFMTFHMEILHKGKVAANYYNRGELKVSNNKEAWENIQPRKHYRVLAKVKPPFVYSSNGNHFGYLIEMLQMMASIQNFTYELTVLPDTQAYTSEIFIEKMLKGKFDIGLGPVYESVSTKQYDKISFSIPYYKMVGIKFLMKNTKDDSIFTFITVLEPIVWTCILSAFFMNSFLLWASERFGPYSYRNNKEKYVDDEEVRDFTAKETLWFCLTSITPDGGGIPPKHVSGRLIVITWWLFGFIILASYTANLAAFLTLSKMKNSIQNFDDLCRQFRMRYAPLRGSDELAYINAMHLGEATNRKYVFNGKEYPMPNKFNRITLIINMTGPPNDTETALQMVYDSETPTVGFAFIVDSADARYLLMTRCKLIDVEEEAAKRNLVIVTPNVNSLLRYDIDYAITLIQSRQWEMELEKKWWDNNPYKSTNCTELEDDDEGIGIANIGGVFLMIFMGIGISMITMAYDYVRYRRRIEATVTPVATENTASTPELPLESESTIPEKKKEDDDEGSTRLQRRNVAKY